MLDRLSSWWWKDERQPLREGIASVLGIFIIVVFLVLAFTGSSDPVRTVAVISPLFVVAGWLSFFAGSSAFGRRKFEPRPWLVVGGGLPARIFFVAGSAWLAGYAAVSIYFDEIPLGILAAGIAVLYFCMAYPSPLSIRRAYLSGLGAGLAALGALL